MEAYMISKAQIRATTRYIKENYDTLIVRMKKNSGLMEAIAHSAKREGKSRNQYVSDALTCYVAEHGIHQSRNLFVGKNATVYHIMNRETTVADVTVLEDRKAISFVLFEPPGIKQPFSGGKLNLNRFFQFLQSRCFEEGRGDLPEILKLYHMKDYNVWEMVRKTRGIMMDDGFWIRFDNESVKWEEVNPWSADKRLS